MQTGIHLGWKLKKIIAACVGVLVVLTFLNLPYGNSTVMAQSNYEFISEPGNVPLLRDFITPVIEPGDSGVLKFSLTNRYFESNYASNNLTDVELTLGIYECATLKESKRVDDSFESSPIIEKELSSESTSGPMPSGSMGIVTVEPETGIKLFRFFWPVLPENTTFNLELLITTGEDTPEGIYFIKTEMIFHHSGIENKSFKMRSKGYYTQTEWDIAKGNAPEDFTPGINLSYLEIDGIIPETSFSVKVSVPRWPLYILVGITSFFALIGIVFYYMEEHGKFPTFKAWLDRISRKF
ncbi:MAG: hypothetical protein JSV49_06780 [Thermoplasmata archaeon]|nr:MAG: hypothetical protein JSV49_06780 [Thermoplasmata archaeon]